MKKKLLFLLSYILVAAAATTATLFLCGGWQEPSKLDQLEELILDHFIGEADSTAMEDAAATAMVSALGDRWSYYIPAEEYAAYLEQMNNAYVGVGITIQVAPEEGGFLILEVTEGGSAQEAGLQAGDILTAVSGTSTQGLTSEDTRNLVRGKEGTFVELTVQRGNQQIQFSVERRTIQTPVAEYRMLPEQVGYISIANFDRRCADETLAAVEALLEQDARALIFDVRGNPGGYADEMVRILDRLLPEGELFRTVDYAGREHVDRSDENFLDLPMAVLVNGDSYSAAEFFGAALREYEAAVIVGQKTTGKGYFQNTFQLSDGSAVGLSVGKYYTPQGENLAEVGITPNVVVEITEEEWLNIYYGRTEPQEDPQLQAAWEYLTR